MSLGRKTGWSQLSPRSALITSAQAFLQPGPLNLGVSALAIPIA